MAACECSAVWVITQALSWRDWRKPQQNLSEDGWSLHVEFNVEPYSSVTLSEKVLKLKLQYAGHEEQMEDKGWGWA